MQGHILALFTFVAQPGYMLISSLQHRLKFADRKKGYIQFSNEGRQLIVAPTKDLNPVFLQSGGEMGELTRYYPWTNTSVGSIADWPLSLCTLVNMMLNSRFPMLIFWGPDLVTFYNDAFRPSLGNDGKHPSSLGQRGEESWAESWPVIGPMIRNIMAGGDAVYFEDQQLPIYREGKMGYAYWTYSFSPLSDDNGQVSGVLVTCSETTKSVEATRQLERSESQFQNLVWEAAIGIIVLIGKEMKVEVVNDAYAKLVGRSTGELSGKHLFEVIPEAAPFFRPILDKVLSQQEPIYLNNTIYTVLDNKGRRIEGYLNLVYQPYKEVNGLTTGVMVLCQDVTTQVLLQQRIEESERRLLSSFNELTVGVAVIVGADLHFQMVNVSYATLCGRRPEDLMGKTLLEAMPELTGAGFDILLKRVLDTGRPYVAKEVPAQIQRYGRLETIYIDYTYQPQYNAAGNATSVLIVVVDITEQVNARKKVERAEENLRMAIDAAELASYYINTTDRIFVASPRLKTFFGFEPDEEVPYEAAINQIHPDYRQAAADLVEAAITQGVRFDMEYPIIGHNDGKIRWVRGVGTVQHDNDGKTYFTGLLNEITEKKQDEIRKNDFIGMVSHELKTPLTSINAYLQFLQAQAIKKEDAFSAGLLQKANKQVGKMTAMVNGFLNLSRLESGKLQIDKTRFDMAGLMKETEEETVPMITSHRVVFAPVEPTQVDADRDKIGHVINNLINNAVKYSPLNSTIRVACLTSNGNVQVSVQDEGIGIQAADKEKLFERYYRVEGNNSIAGFGIGLYLCKEIIDRHNGSIWVESEPGKGSTFFFSLPVG